MKRLAVVVLLVVLLGAAGLASWGALAEPVDVAPPPTDLSDMVYVPGGAFVAAGRRHVLDSYWIDRFEVTEADWNRDAAAVGIPTPPYGEGEPRGVDFPVRYVTWGEAVRFARHRFKRLPTNLEWERACQGPQGQSLPWGSGYLAAANTLEAWSGPRSRNRGVTRVGTFEHGRSGVGAYDMIGNVAEWTADGFRSLIHRKATAEEIRQWSAGLEVGEPSYIVRGASFATRIGGTGAAPEDVELAGARVHDLGFRCAISADELELQRTVIQAIRDLGYSDPWNRRLRATRARKRLTQAGFRALPYLRRARERAANAPWLEDRIVAIMDAIARRVPAKESP